MTIVIIVTILCVILSFKWVRSLLKYIVQIVFFILVCGPFIIMVSEDLEATFNECYADYPEEERMDVFLREVGPVLEGTAKGLAYDVEADLRDRYRQHNPDSKIKDHNVLFTDSVIPR